MLWIMQVYSGRRYVSGGRKEKVHKEAEDMRMKSRDPEEDNVTALYIFKENA